MLQVLKSLSKRLPYPLFLRLFYFWHARTDLKREHSALAQTDLPWLEGATIAARTKSDTLFVLGGGSSINRITPDRWAAIARADSIGINFWPLHPFVPTFHIFEQPSPFEQQQADVLMRETLARRAQDYRETLKIVMNFEIGGKPVPGLSEGFKSNLFAACTVPAPARTPEELIYALRYLEKRNYFSGEGSFSALFKYASTVTTVLALACKLGYRRVILCGIDLKLQEYFFQDPALYPETAAIAFRQRTETHPTNVALEWRIPAQDVVKIFYETILQSRGIELYVENRESALWPGIPEVPADVFKSAAQNA